MYKSGRGPEDGINDGISEGSAEPSVGLAVGGLVSPSTFGRSVGGVSVISIAWIS